MGKGKKSKKTKKGGYTGHSKAIAISRKDINKKIQNRHKINRATYDNNTKAVQMSSKEANRYSDQRGQFTPFQAPPKTLPFTTIPIAQQYLTQAEEEQKTEIEKRKKNLEAINKLRAVELEKIDLTYQPKILDIKEKLYDKKAEYEVRERHLSNKTKEWTLKNDLHREEIRHKDNIAKNVLEKKRQKNENANLEHQLGKAEYKYDKEGNIINASYPNSKDGALHKRHLLTISQQELHNEKQRLSNLQTDNKMKLQAEQNDYLLGNKEKNIEGLYDKKMELESATHDVKMNDLKLKNMKKDYDLVAKQEKANYELKIADLKYHQAETLAQGNVLRMQDKYSTPQQPVMPPQQTYIPPPPNPYNLQPGFVDNDRLPNVNAPQFDMQEHMAQFNNVITEQRNNEIMGYDDPMNYGWDDDDDNGEDYIEPTNPEEFFEEEEWYEEDGDWDEDENEAWVHHDAEDRYQQTLVESQQRYNWNDPDYKEEDDEDWVEEDWNEEEEDWDDDEEWEEDGYNDWENYEGEDMMYDQKYETRNKESRNNYVQEEAQKRYNWDNNDSDGSDFQDYSFDEDDDDYDY